MVAMVRKERYVIAFLLTTLVFVVGISIGSEITRSRIESIQRSLQIDVLDSQSLEVELSILQQVGQKDYLCAYVESRLPGIVRKKVELGRKFDVGDVPKENADLLTTQFVVSLGRYFVFENIQEKECNIEKPKILFFSDKSEKSREQAKVLDNIVFRMGDVNITVFSFGSAIIDDQQIVKLIYNFNNVTATPTIIIKGVKYEGFQSLDTVINMLCESYNNKYTRAICK